MLGEHSTDGVIGSAAKGNYLSCDPEIFRNNFGKHPFPLQHKFAESGLFTLHRLARAAEQLIESGRGYRFSAHLGQNSISTDWDSMPQLERVASAVESIGEQKAWMKVSALNEADPEYVEFLGGVIGDISDLLDRDFSSQVTHAQVTAFIASPGIATPYHIDHEENFLCQVYGEKDVCLYEPADRENLPDSEIERFYFGNYKAAIFKEATASRGKVFRLSPGVAVHHPSLAGHWVQNGDSPSVSISISFCTKEIDSRAYVYQGNYLLRQLGLPQGGPGQHRFWDGLKKGAIRSISNHHPKTFRELIFSGPDRIKASAKFARNLVKGSAGHTSQA